MSKKVTPEFVKQLVKNDIKQTALHWTRQNILHAPRVVEVMDWLREVADELERGDLEWDKELP
jgi:hypothetical protein